MMFCPRCGSLLKAGKDGSKDVVYCSCGYKSSSQKVVLGEKPKVDPNAVRFDIVEQDDSDLVYPETDADCPKCGNKRAHYWMIQTRAGDEPETKFYKCTKCKNVWRDYG